MKISPIILLMAVMLRLASAQNITIVESQSAGHVMDTVWYGVASSMGMNPQIVPQAALYDTTFFATTDALIVSSGVIALTGLQMSTISEFMKSGKNMYLQGEYDCSSFNANSNFESLVNDNGGNFTWNGIIAGTLVPMNVSGTLSTTPNIIAPLSYFWYGCRGTACAYVEPFLEYNNDNFGFIFCPPAGGYGRVVCTSDQDWVQSLTSLPLMENILTLLVSDDYQCSGSYFLSAYLGNDTTICEDSSLVLTAGSSGFNHLWSTGSTASSITVTTAGTYWLTVSNSACSVTDTIVVSQISCSSFSPSFISSDSDVCEKFCVSFVDQSTNDPDAWLWLFPGGAPSSSNDQNPVNICYNNPGTYDVTLITTNATGNDTLTLANYITVHGTPSVPVITQSGYTLTSTPSFSYQWQLNNNDIPGATNQSYVVAQTGYYTIVIMDENGCSSSATEYVLITGLENVLSDMNVLVYPNPSDGNFIVELSNCLIADHVTIEIVNMMGQVVYSSEEKIPDNHFSKVIDASELSEGIYFLRLSTTGPSGKIRGAVNKKIIVLK